MGPPFAAPIRGPLSFSVGDITKLVLLLTNPIEMIRDIHGFLIHVLRKHRASFVQSVLSSFEAIKSAINYYLWVLDGNFGIWSAESLVDRSLNCQYPIIWEVGRQHHGIHGCRQKVLYKRNHRLMTRVPQIEAEDTVIEKWEGNLMGYMDGGRRYCNRKMVRLSYGIHGRRQKVL